MVVLVVLVGLSLLTQGCGIKGTWTSTTTVTETVNGEEKEVYSSNAEGDIVSGAEYGLPFPVLAVNRSEVNGETVIGQDEEAGEEADVDEGTDADEANQEDDGQLADSTDEPAASDETSEVLAQLPEGQTGELEQGDGWDKDYQGIGQ